MVICSIGVLDAEASGAVNGDLDRRLAEERGLQSEGERPCRSIAPLAVPCALSRSARRRMVPPSDSAQRTNARSPRRGDRVREHSLQKTESAQRKASMSFHDEIEPEDRTVLDEDTGVVPLAEQPNTPRWSHRPACQPMGRRHRRTGGRVEILADWPQTV
jgi:hypothetical protein